ncbi:MAG: sterol desaturase family protein [Bdellovibrio sp.]|nr:sterol desaturase family protein [Methylotenera sp.]
MNQISLLAYADNTLPFLAWAVCFFLSIYLLAASLVFVLAKTLNRPIETRPVSANQIFTEVVQSLRSILLFGVGMMVPWLMLRYNISQIKIEASAVTIALEFMVLVLWNDVHFYAVHRLLHSKLKWAHLAHHKSVTATPFTAYSMGIIEALLLGSVMPLAMLVHHFSLISLALLPIWSIGINALAHSNCNLFSSVSEHSILSLVRHHQSHHSRYSGNFSFLFNQLDRWFGTARPF